MGQAILFYLFATILIFSSLLVVMGRNPVHSVLFLILAFFNAAGLFLLAQAEFLAMMLVIVYVGAVAVLFLFVVMMLDINLRSLTKGVAKYGIIGGLLGGILFTEMLIAAIMWFSSPQTPLHIKIASLSQEKTTNAHALGHVIYTHYLLIFQAAGIILLVAMIGAIVLTLRHRIGVRRQNISQQVNRAVADTLEIKKVSFRQGIRS